MSKKVWNYRNKNYSFEDISELSKIAHIPPLIALLLKNRGITEPNEIQEYLTKTLKAVHNPIDLKDVEQATERIVTAIKNREKITVYGDYDVDGVTSTALMIKFLREHGAEADYYIPNRENEGYGINVMAVNRISKNGTKLLITVDCGITSTGEVELAKTLGMDVIVTDHHLCKEKIPAAIAVIDPKRPDCDYPFDALAGVGVAFKLILSIAKALGEKTAECFYKYVELAAVGTVADVVSLLDENRVIVEKGLELMRDSKNAGIRALIEVSQADKRPINATTIAFMLAPRINAGGRIGSAQKAVELLLCEEYEKAKELAQELEKDNNERRLCEQKIFEEAVSMIENNADFDKERVIVLGQKGWHHGVIGIVASRITETYYRPSILISYDENGVGKGSGRSIDGFNLFNALDACSDLLTKFGGHAMAAGIGIKKDDAESFSAKINLYAKEMLSDADLTPKIYIDCELSPSMVTVKNAKLLDYMEPFGEANPKPVFSICNAQIKRLELVGTDASHVRMTLEKNGVIMNAVGFRMGYVSEYKKVGDFIDVAFTLEINNFRDMESAQLILKDIR